MSDSRIKSVVIRDIKIPMRYTFSSAVGRRVVKECLIVEVISNDGISGYAECSARPDPYFAPDFNEGVKIVIANFLVPAIIGLTCKDAAKVTSSTRVRGWPFARDALLSAIADLNERSISEGKDNQPKPLSIKVGTTLSLPSLIANVGHDVHRAGSVGYSRVRVKLAPSLPWRDLLMELASLPNDIALAADFNGSLDPGNDHHLRICQDLKEACGERLRYIEQPFGPQFVIETAKIRKHLKVQISLDESITDLESLRIAIHMNALDICNIKLGRVGGAATASQIASTCKAAQIVPQLGGMFETGLGRWASARFAGRELPDSCHDFTLPSAYLIEDLILDPIGLTAGRVEIKDRPARVSLDAMDRYTARRVKLS